MAIIINWRFAIENNVAYEFLCEAVDSCTHKEFCRIFNLDPASELDIQIEEEEPDYTELAEEAAGLSNSKFDLLENSSDPENRNWYTASIWELEEREKER